MIGVDRFPTTALCAACACKAAAVALVAGILDGWRAVPTAAPSSAWFHVLFIPRSADAGIPGEGSMRAAGTVCLGTAGTWSA